MRARRFAPLLAWFWAGLVTVLYVAVVVVFVRAEMFDPALLNPSGWIYLGLGTLIALRRPGNAIGWLLMVSGTVFTLPTFGLLALIPPDLTEIEGVWAWVVLQSNLVFIPIVFPPLFVLLLFPTGRPPGRRWRWVVAYGVVLGIGIFMLNLLSPELVHDGAVVLNPASPFIGAAAERFQAFIDSPDTPFLVAMLLFAVAAAAAPLVRYRWAGAVERAQIRWLLFAGALFAGSLGVNLFLGFAESGLRTALWGLGQLAVPVAVAFAILRHRVFDIDVIIRRTLQYGVLTAILVGLYAGAVLLSQTLLGPLVGGADSPPVVIVTTLILAALFNPLRIRVQRFIDRRFYRRKVDAERALARFSAFARDEVDLEELRRAMFGVVGETLQPERMGLWFKAAPEERPMGGPR